MFDDTATGPLGSTPLAPEVVAWEAERAARRGRVIELASQIHAAEAELVGLIADLDRDEAWAGPGYLTLGHWLGVQRRVHPRRSTSGGSASPNDPAELPARLHGGGGRSDLGGAVGSGHCGGHPGH